MNKFIKTTLLSLCFVTLSLYTVNANDANVAPTAKIECVEGSSNLTVKLINLLEANTYISLRDAAGRSVYSKSIYKQNAFAKQLDLSQLADGRYTLYIEHKKVDITQPISVKDGVVTVLEAERVEVIAPTIELTEDKVAFRLAPTTNVKKVTVTILKDAEIVYQEEAWMTSTTKKQYDLSKLYPDTYTFQLEVEDKMYFERLDLK